MTAELPVEIWHRIFLYVAAGNRRRKDLCNLCNVSKTICSIAQPLLYRQVYRRDADALLSLVETCLQWPILAACVKDFLLPLTQVPNVLRDKGHMFRPSSGFDPAKLAAACPTPFAITPEEMSQLINFTAPESYPSAGGRDGKKGACSDINRLFSILVLTHLPNLECLSLFVNDLDTVGWTSKTVGQDHDNVPFLTSLKQVNVKVMQSGNVFPLSRIAAFLVLSKIDTLRVNQVSGLGEDFTFPTTTSIKRLRLMNSILTAAQLRSIVHACPLLEEFHYSALPNRQITRNFSNELSPREAWEALSPVKTQLKSLMLDFKAKLRFKRQRYGRNLTTGTFADFTQLETLYIDGFVFSKTSEPQSTNTNTDTDTDTDADIDRPPHILPPNLRGLTVFGALAMIQPLITLAKSLETTLPNLEYLEFMLYLNFWHSTHETLDMVVRTAEEGGWSELVAICNRAGVTVRWRLVNREHPDMWLDRDESWWDDAPCVSEWPEHVYAPPQTS